MYGPSVGFGFVAFDDHTYLLGNPTITAPGSVPLSELFLTPQQRYIVPVTGFLQMGLYQLGGGAAWPFHTLNVLLHCLLAYLVFALAVALGARRTVAAAAAALMALHPLCAEPVAWVTGGKDVLMATLAVGATLALVRGRWWLAGALGVAAALAKPAAVALGAAWLGYAALRWFKRRRTGEGEVPRALWVTASVVTGLGVALSVANLTMYRALIRQPAVPDEGSFKLFMALGWQAHHVFWPANLHPIYPIDRTAGFGDWHTWLGLLLVVAGVGVLALLARRPRWALGALVAVATWLPSSNLLPFPRFLADSYAYAPLAGIAVVLALVLSRFRRSDIAMAVVAVALAVAAVPQVGRWESGEALWSGVTQAHPEWASAWFNLGHERFVARSSPEHVVDAFHTGFQRGYDTDALGNYAISLARLGRMEDAECVFLEAVDRSRDRRQALFNLGVYVASNPVKRYAPDRVGRAVASLRAELDAGGLAFPPALLPRLPSGAAGAPVAAAQCAATSPAATPTRR